MRIIKLLMAVIALILLLSIFFVLGCTSQQQSSSGENSGSKVKATVFKSPSCGCCVGYAAELERQGYNVETINTIDMRSIKQKYNIPRNMESCHTTIVGEYFVEGHVPIEAVNKLLSEKPSIDGIALPNMPAGSPGMPGIKRAPFKIYALSGGEISEFMTI